MTEQEKARIRMLLAYVMLCKKQGVEITSEQIVSDFERLEQITTNFKNLREVK